MLTTLSGVLLLSLVGTACSSGSEEDKPDEKDAKPPAMKQRWDLEADAVMALWQHGNTVAVLRREDSSEGGREPTLSGHAADSGKKKWSFSLPDSATAICAASEQVNSDGWGLIALERGGECSLLATVDIQDGSRGWQKPLDGYHHDFPDTTKLTVGEKVVAFGEICPTVLRFDVKDGTKLPPLVKDEFCGGPVTYDESVIALRRESLDEQSDDEQARKNLELYETDTGRRLWRRSIDRDGRPAILTSDPLTLATKEDGKVVVKTYDSNGRPTPIVDISSGASDVAAVGEGVLVISQKGGWRAYDLRKGEELWSRKKGGHFTPKIVQRNGIVSIRAVRQKNDSSLWVTRHDLHNPEKQEMLGTIDAEAIRVIGWDAEHLYVLNLAHNEGSRLETYALPEKGSRQPYRGTPGNEIAVQGPAGPLQ